MDPTSPLNMEYKPKAKIGSRSKVYKLPLTTSRTWATRISKSSFQGTVCPKMMIANWWNAWKTTSTWSWHQAGSLEANGWLPTMIGTSLTSPSRLEESFCPMTSIAIYLMNPEEGTKLSTTDCCHSILSMTCSSFLMILWDGMVLCWRTFCTFEFGKQNVFLMWYTYLRRINITESKRKCKQALRFDGKIQLLKIDIFFFCENS